MSDPSRPQQLVPDPTAGFLGGPAGRFDSAGREQLAALLEHELTPESTVLDIGCGCLRGGRWIIPLLATGHYCGIEPNREMLERGLRDFLDPGIAELKQPRFDHNDRFDLSVFDETFTHMIARSVWSHAAKPQIETMLDGVAKVGSEKMVFLTSFIEPSRKRRDYQGSEWVGISHESSKAGLVAHSFRWIKTVCAARGLAAELSKRPPLGGQTWIAITRA